MPGIKLQKVLKTFGDITALKSIDLNVGDGEFFVLVGPTGAGKTTTLRVIAGLEKVDSGTVMIGDQNANHLTPAERDVAFVYQSFSLYPQLTVRRNLEFPLNSPLHRESREAINERVEMVAGLLHITRLLDRMPDALSGGEMQRVGIGRAIVRRPQIFLMDEPLSDLDAKLREELRVELHQIQTELKTTTFYVTHDQIEAMSMGNRLAVLNKGTVLQVGTPKEIYNRPADLFVAGFIGSPKMNFFSCSANGQLVLEGGAIKLVPGRQLAEKADRLARKDDLVLGIRPEAVKIHAEQARQRFQADVLFIEHFGSMNVANLQVGEKIFKARTRPTYTAKPRQKVWIELDEQHAIFFDRESGKALG